MDPSFLNPIPVLLDTNTISALFPNQLPVLFSLLVYFLFVFNWEILFIHPGLLLPLFDLPLKYTLQFVILEDANLQHEWVVWQLSYLQDSLLWSSFKHITEETKGCSSEVCDPYFSPTPSIQDPALLRDFCSSGCPGLHKTNNPFLFVSVRSSKVCLCLFLSHMS